jgi:DNA-binding response OmpR family regulator
MRTGDIMKILMADDNKDIIDILDPHFKHASYNMDYAYDGKVALDLFYKNHYDLIILDVMMPYVDGFSVCKEIRSVSNVPIMMITAKSEDEDFIMGIEIGADDYIVKPFSPKKVLAKIKALVRRLDIDSEHSTIILDDIEVNLGEYSAKIKDDKINLTKKEIELLYLFVKNPKRVYSREVLLDLLWGDDYFGETRTVDTHIKRLRFKLHNHNMIWDIKTVWGVGYKFEKNIE